MNGDSLKLEECFDNHPLSNKLFITPGTEGGNFPSVEIQGNFDDYKALGFVSEFPYFDFPLPNYLIDRYFGKKHSFLKGKVMICFDLPRSIPLKITRVDEEKFELFAFNQVLEEQFIEYGHYFCSESVFDNYGGKTKQNFLAARREFLDEILSFRPSLSSLQIGESKIVFNPSSYWFSDDTDGRSKSRITRLLNQLFDSEEFLSYYFSVLYPYLLAYSIDTIKETLENSRLILKSL